MARIKSGFMGERAIVLPEQVIDEYRSTPVGTALYLTDIGFYPKADFHFRSRLKDESFQYVLIYCTEGEGWYQIEQTRYKVSANQAFILPKGKSHSYGSVARNPWTIYWIHFDGQLAFYLSDTLDKPVSVYPEKDSRIEERFKLFEEIYSTLRNGYSKNNLDYCSTVLLHFLGSIKYLNAYRGSSSQSGEQRDLVDEAIHYMRENIRKRITLKDISQYLGISISHLSAIFPQKTGYSPLNYLSHLKIQEACHYLDFSDMKVNQISMLIGFEDPFYFSRLFSKIMGTSPTEYRSRKKG